MDDIPQGLAQTPFADHYHQSHRSFHKNRDQQNQQKLPPTKTSTQCASELPVSGTEAADQHEGQQQPQACYRPQQRRFQSRPVKQNRVDRDPGGEARHGEPVRNSALAPVNDSCTHRHQRRENPWAENLGAENPGRENPEPRLKHGFRWQTGASARFASCTLGLSGATLKGKFSVVSCQFSVTADPSLRSG